MWLIVYHLGGRMKLKTESSTFQNAVLAIVLGVYIAISNVIWNLIDGPGLMESKNWMLVIIYHLALALPILFVSYFLQFVFGLPWICGDPDKPCASLLKWLDEYQPSSMRLSSSFLSGKYRVELNLVFDADDLIFLNSDCPRSGLHYFRFFEGYFPFEEEKKTRLYLTRAAMRQIRRAVKSVIKSNPETMAGYVQLRFKIEIPYYGREILASGEEYWLLSMWDLREIERISRRSELTVDDLALSPEKLAEYRNYFADFKRDTFIRVEPE